MRFCILIFSSASFLWPQEPAPVQSTVTVIGSRSPMEIDKSPVSTSVVTRQELENRNIRQIDQALTLTEGVNSLRAKGPADNDFGLGLRGFAGRGGQNRTLILLDGQPMNNSYIGNVNWSTFSPSEMERVEVARGPFSSLYGGNAMGGVINMITRPVDKRHLEVMGQYGNRETTNYSLRASDRFFQKLGLSVGYNRFQTGGYSPQEVLKSPSTLSGGIPVVGVTPWLTPTNGLTYQIGARGRNWFHQEAWRTRAEYNFSPKHFASFQYMRQSRQDGYDAYTTNLRDTTGNPVDSGLVLSDNRRFSVTPANFIGTPTAATMNILQAQLLSTLSSHWTLRVASGITLTPQDYYITPGANATLNSGSGNYVNTASRGIYGNIQASWSGNGKSFIAGTELRHDRAAIAAQLIPNYAIREGFAPPDSQAKGKSLNQAAYAQYQFEPLENLLVVAGGRWDYWRTYDGANQTGLTSPLIPYPDRSSNAFTGKLAATYRITTGFQIRGSVANAFRNPTVYDLYRDLNLSGTYYLANPNVRPERLFAYEGGITKSFRPGNSLEATYFINRVSDLIYRTTDFAANPNGSIRRLTNAGLSQTRGVEVAARQTPLRWLQLRQSYTFTRARILENNALPATVGKNVPYVPEHTLSYLASAGWQRWTATWSGRYSSPVFSTDTNTDVVRGVPGSYSPFFETDFTAGYKLNKHLSLFATADNLLDRRYYLYFLTPGRSVYGGFRFQL
ncbi:TonB-dependent receptor [Bryobacter aggregatus]|uniref:TonB-dependent receptor n=1 Tax=Bryobacter aggregatus TaxID=360054 RepID=UPI0004E1ED18|nr:TonB-dependent receptor [Bryobacter aggregatus]